MKNGTKFVGGLKVYLKNKKGGVFMAEDKKQCKTESSLSIDSLEAHDVLEGAEPWEPIETKLVLWSFAIAVVVLLIGLWFVPSSILH